MSLTEKIEALLDARGMTQAGLAPLIGVTPQRLSLWLNGTGTPKPMHLLRMARVFRVDVEYLIDDAIDGPPRQERPSDDETWVLRTFRALQIDADEAVRRLAGRVVPIQARPAPSSEIATNRQVDRSRPGGDAGGPPARTGRRNKGG